MSDDRARLVQELRVWLLPLSLLFGAGLTVFVLSVGVDVVGGPGMHSLVDLLFWPDPESAQNTLSSAAEVVAAVLAIAITVVAIIVELASNRYTHRITELFVGEPINFFVMGFFVVTALQGLWVNLIITPDGAGFTPHVAIGVTMVMLTICLLILLPYFAFVFAFLNPINIVDRIRSQTLRGVEKFVRSDRVPQAQSEAVRGVEQLQDVSLNAMEHKDKGVSMAGVEAMSTLLVEYQQVRQELPTAWFGIDGRLAHNPDFVSMAPEVLDDIRERQIWFEWKVLRAFQSLYNDALNRMRDINYLVAINTRLIANAAWESENEPLLDMVLKFFNTYLRSAINAHDIRTAYNVLNQYRLVAEEALRREPNGERAVSIAKHFKYYGLLSYNAQLPFILETVAYDMCALTEYAFDSKNPATRQLLRIFLQVDKESESATQENSLRGVRKAQLKLASYFMLRGDEELAREVYEDMKDESPERLASIRDELMGVESREFWEISDRGVNFDYLPRERKEQVLIFFDWFGDVLPPMRSSVFLSRNSDRPAVPADAGTAEPPEMT